MLVILDGFGYNPKSFGNAVHVAKMPFWRWLINNYPHTLLHASGQHVGLLPGYIGNSEVGHLTIGAGRVVESVLKRFHDSIDDGSFFDNQVLIENFNKIKNTGAALHLMGLLSDGGVHSHECHLHAMIKLAATVGLKNVYIHAFLDGRDVAPKSAALYLQNLQQKIEEFGVGKIASVSGRFYAMDRDNNWDRTELCYKMLVGQAKPSDPADWHEVLRACYEQGVTDEFVTPTLLDQDGCIKNGDGIVFFNFRPDRARQLAESFLNPSFDKFKTVDLCSTTNTLSFFVSTVRYYQSFAKFNNQILFEQKAIKNTFLDVLAAQPMPPKVFIIAETEKYAHVTYFFRGMVDKQLPNEMRVLIPSIKVKNYINNPEMSAQEITKTLLNSLQISQADFYLVNYANADMVGHSGDMPATIKACECLDKQLELLYKQVVETMNGTMFIVADHGNAESKIDAHTGQPNTAHTTNPVPFVLVRPDFKSEQITSAQNDALWPEAAHYGLANISPTILKFMRIKASGEMVESIDLLHNRSKIINKTRSW